MNNQTITDNDDPRNFSLFNLKNLIEAVAYNDIEKFTEIHSILTSAVIDVFRMQHPSLWFFGFIDPGELATMESLITLEILSRFKTINLGYFFDTLQEMNIETSMFNKYSKQEFHLLENIFSELIYIIQSQISLEAYFAKVLSLAQDEKFSALKEFLEKNSFNFQKLPITGKALESVFSYLNDRSKWKELQTLQEELVRFNSEMRLKTEQSRKNTLPHVNSIKSNQYEHKVINTEEGVKKESSKSTIRESDELKIILKQLSKVVFNTENENNNSIFDKKSVDENIFKTQRIQTEKSQTKDLIINTKPIHKDKPSPIETNLASTTHKPNSTKVHSAEGNCGQYILKEYMKNIKKSFINMMFKMQNEEGCVGCQDSMEGETEPIDFTINLSKFKIFKSSAIVNKQAYGKSKSSRLLVLNDSPREAEKENQFKSTNIRTFISKNNEDTIKNKTVVENHATNRKMSKFDDKLSVILDNSKNNSFFSSNKNNVSISNKIKLEKNCPSVNKSFRSLNDNKVLNDKISRIEEKMTKMKKNCSFDTIILNNLSDNNKSQNKEKHSDSVISGQSKTIKHDYRGSNFTPSGTNKVLQELNFEEQKNSSKPVVVKADSTSYFNSIKESYLVPKQNTKNLSNVVLQISNRNTLHPSKEPKIQVDKNASSAAGQINNQSNKVRMNLDSRVNSQNDLSKFKDSQIVQRNSFLSQNF